MEFQEKDGMNRGSKHGPLRVAGFVAAALGAFLPGRPADATDGYFSHGYGTQSEGMGGVSIAYPKDTLVIATNPAAIVDLGDRFDVGLEAFRPDRGATIEGNGAGLNGKNDGSGWHNFYIPEFGYVRRLSDNFSAGVAVYGNGGMNTHYETNPFAAFGGQGVAGINLEQAFLSPTIAYKFAEGHSIGLSANVAYQLFKAQGIGIFAGNGQSTDPASFSDRGTDQAWGGGLRLGYLGHLTPELSVGAFWQSKTWSGRFSKYAGLFAEHGGFDIPSTYGIGAAYALTPALDLALDVTRIEYSGVASVGNSNGSLGGLGPDNAFGTNNGPGFGWSDVTAVKLGVNYKLTPDWQVRAGYNYSTQPIPNSQTLLNILAPGVVQHHFTTGVTWSAGNGWEISGYALYAPTNTVTGSGSIPAGFGGGESNISLSEFALGVAVGWKFGT